MNDQKKNAEQSGDSTEVDIEPSETEGVSGTKNQSGDPGRTPGKAEGDRETVEADLGENK
mgnify:CR=1 FL=1|jgi:hypothetical protein